MRDDLKGAVRSLRSNRGFTFAALIVLTLGIGATTAIFSVVDAVVLRSLPFNEPDRLVAVGQRSALTPTSGAISRDPARLMFVAPQNYRDWAAQQQVFESMAAIASGWLTLRLPGVAPESLVRNASPPTSSRCFASRLRLGGRSRSRTRPRVPIAWLCEAMLCGAAASALILRQRLHEELIVAEVSLAVVLLVGAALFIGSFVALTRIDPGFDTTNVLTARAAGGWSGPWSSTRSRWWRSASRSAAVSPGI
jgi:hypothetical protein